MIPDVLRDNVRAARERLRLNRNQLASASNLRPTQIKEIEEGENENPELRTLVRLAGALNVGLDALISNAPPADRVAEPRAPYGHGADVLDIPLVAEGVGAGRPTLRVLPGAERPYHFRRDWLVRKGWTEADPDRFGVYRLGTDEVALSMFPTIQPESALLVDLRADRNSVAPRSIWVVHASGGLVVKRVTAERDLLVLESDNPDPEYAPQIVRATSAERGRILEGLVIWYATEVA